MPTIKQIFAATGLVVATAHAHAGYVRFESPMSRYGHYEPDLLNIATDPFITSPCALRGEGPFPGQAAAVWTAGTSPCVTLQEVGPFELAGDYKMTLLDASGAKVYEENFSFAPLGNDMATLRQAPDPATGLPVFEWCAKKDHDSDDHHGHHHDHDRRRECVPRNDLVVARRRLTLTLPKGLESCKDCTLQLQAPVDGVGAQRFACANVDVAPVAVDGRLELETMTEASPKPPAAQCESEPAELSRYVAATAAVWALEAFWSLWKWTIVTFLVLYILVLVGACVLGRREKQRRRFVEPTLVPSPAPESGLPVYDDHSESPTKSAEAAGLGRVDLDGPEASLLVDTEASTGAAAAAEERRGCRFAHRGTGKCESGGHGQCSEPSALRVGYHMAGPRRARRCMRVLCALLSVGYVLTGIVAGLMILHYQA